MSGGGSLLAGAAAAPPAPPAPPALSARGARIAGGGPGLLDAGFALYVADPFDRELNPQVRRAAGPAAPCRKAAGRPAGGPGRRVCAGGLAQRRWWRRRNEKAAGAVRLLRHPTPAVSSRAS